MIVGMDFGTTNSGMAVYDGRRVELLPLDPANVNPNVARTALYLTNDQSVTIGREAVDKYFADNIGRPVRMKRVWVGEVEVYGADMYYVTDVYVWADILSPGRLFLSIKSGLRDPEYQGTVVGQAYYSLENLVAIYMSLARIRAERILGQDVRQVVLGRPVHFSMDPQADDLAQRRLLDAAFRAGFETVYLQYEPVAAAYNYAANIRERQNILVFDFGGGTLDITVMRLDGRQGREVLATGGVPIAGDVFDRRIVRARLPKHFGAGTHYGPPGHRLPMPKWIYEVFSDWQNILELQTPKSRKLLQEIAQTTEDRRGIEALISLVANNYSLQMFDTVEAAKRKLSTEMAAIIRFRGPGFNVTEMVTRSQFENIIRAEIQAIDRHLDETLAASGLAPAEIDAVIRTGGSSDIPAFRYMLAEKFGRSKVIATDTFSSVTSGLAIIANGIAQSEIQARAYRSEDVPRRSQASPRQHVAAVNLALLQRRLIAQEDRTEATDSERDLALIALASDGRLLVGQLDQEALDQTRSLPLPLAWPAAASLQGAQIVSLDLPILLITSEYQFFLTTGGHLLDLENLNLSIPRFLQLKENEFISAINPWPPIKEGAKLALTTSKGYLRTYPLNGLIEAIEGPTPYRFDQPLPGLPRAVSGASAGNQLAICLDNGRAIRANLDDLPLIGLQAIKRNPDEQIVGVHVIQAADRLALVTDTGHGRQLAAGWIPLIVKGNTRGRVLVSRRPLAASAKFCSGQTIWAVTTKRLRPLAANLTAADPSDSISTRRWLKLESGERLLGLVTA